MTISELPQMKTINQTAQLFGLAKHYIRQLVLNDKVKYVKAGKKYLINFESLITYLQEGENQTSATIQERKINERKIM